MTRTSEPDRCPNCGSISVHTKRSSSGRGKPRTHPEAYWCAQCKHHFDTPASSDPPD